MAQNPNSFWDFVRSFDNNNNNNNIGNGEGVDRPSQPPGAWPFGGHFGGPFGGPPGGPPFGGHFGGPPPPPPPPPHGDGPHSHHGPGPHHHLPPPHGGNPFDHGLFGQPRGFHYGPGGRCGGGRRGRERRRDRHAGDDNGENARPDNAFDFNGFLASLASHPFAQQYRPLFEQWMGQQSGEVNRENEDEENSFTPPIDTFATETHFVLHVALPGAKKEDVGINWDADKGVLNIAGVIYRQGDEEFLKTLTQGERKVGVFERAIKLPPPGSKDEMDEIDGDAITAKLEDGVLVVRVPKVEKEWTEVKRVDIE